MRPRLLRAAVALLLFPFSLPAQQADTGEMLYPGDVLRVTIYQEKDLSGEFLVNQDGIATLPVLGDRRVTGIPLNLLRDSVRAELRRQLRAPAIEVTPLRRVFVVGEVAKPGPYVVDHTLNLAGAVALAGGASPIGTLHTLQIIRRDGSLVPPFDLTSPAAQPPLRSGDQIYVGRRSWFARNVNVVVSSVLTLLSITTTAIVAASR